MMRLYNGVGTDACGYLIPLARGEKLNRRLCREAVKVINVFVWV